MDKLQKYQNWGLRIVHTNVQPRLNTDDLHAEANVTKFKYRRIAHVFGTMYHR